MRQLQSSENRFAVESVSVYFILCSVVLYHFVYVAPVSHLHISFDHVSVYVCMGTIDGFTALLK